MITVLSYVGILSGFLVFTTVTYLGLLKIKLI
uniref:Cytochrome b6-f complex subunit 6 n=1 Tax=Trebouxiophyceae sp. MX-AZ01 TaxID=1208065 RepID=J7KEK2_9CHLO|nr:subunit VI of cytochrome b6/f complex [Trebouxiophyceae sp. MX-AZ01]AFQ93805.1 subunit VI of cytochrome b6/f complex [Trebouxiophyceae sp. MX-AZ01]